MEGQKLFSKDKIRLMTSQAPFVKQISSAELGFDICNQENGAGVFHFHPDFCFSKLI
jgi:hypothetical protein